jgi:hypothetical protein
MSQPSKQNDPRTHYSLQQEASDDRFFKLNNPKSRNDLDIVIGLEK